MSDLLRARASLAGAAAASRSFNAVGYPLTNHRTWTLPHQGPTADPVDVALGPSRFSGDYNGAAKAMRDWRFRDFGADVSLSLRIYFAWRVTFTATYVAPGLGSFRFGARNPPELGSGGTLGYWEDPVVGAGGGLVIQGAVRVPSFYPAVAPSNLVAQLAAAGGGSFTGSGPAVVLECVERLVGPVVAGK